MITITYDIAMAAGLDAGNRSMRAHGRTSWSAQDAQAAARETNRLLDLAQIPGTVPGSEPEQEQEATE